MIRLIDAEKMRGISITKKQFDFVKELIISGVIIWCDSGEEFIESILDIDGDIILDHKESYEMIKYRLECHSRNN